MNYFALSCLLIGLVIVPAPEAVSPRGAGFPVDLVVDGFPARLSATDYFQDVAGHVITKDFQPYAVNVSVWADGADKQRFFRLPEDAHATYARDGAWTFPTGTVFLQSIVLPLGKEHRRMETRVIVVEENQLAFATYVWREDQKDADLSCTVSASLRGWDYPSRETRLIHREDLDSPAPL
ncbi:MAG: hypothetical protein CMJ83_06965, partial [Planctomycetes bacterium]|nr:hypothetical protein [Planctomycetota bacterium]